MPLGILSSLAGGLISSVFSGKSSKITPQAANSPPSEGGISGFLNRYGGYIGTAGS